MSESCKTLVLVDGSSYLYRAFHAMPDLRAVPGDPSSPATGAIRGMINMMQALQKEQQGDYVACVFDASGPTFRDALYPEYKAHRSPMPDDLRAQIAPIHEVVRLLGWTVLDVPGVEADDVIATLATVAAAQGVRVVVSSGDKDLSQLVNEHITIIDTMSGKVRDVAGVTAEFGVPPHLMVDYQTLVGSGDRNVPGIKGLQPKTALKWLSKYGCLNAILSKADEIPGVAGENLRGFLSWLPVGRLLMMLKVDIDLTEVVPGFPGLDGLMRKPCSQNALLEFYNLHGFKGLARALKGFSDDSAFSGSRGGVSRTPVVPNNPKFIFRWPSVSVSSEDGFYVYKLRNLSNGRFYFGSTSNLRRRWREHENMISKGFHKNRKISSDSCAMESPIFEFRVISCHGTIEAARIREQHYINIFWGRDCCYNESAFVRYSSEDASGELFYVDFSGRKSDLCLLDASSQIVRRGGRGIYLSVHAISRDVGLSKKDIVLILNRRARISGYRIKSAFVSRDEKVVL